MAAMLSNMNAGRALRGLRYKRKSEEATPTAPEAVTTLGMVVRVYLRGK